MRKLKPDVLALSFIVFAVLTVLAVSSCGSSPKHAAYPATLKTLVRQHNACTGNNYVMQCKFNAPGQKPPLTGPFGAGQLFGVDFAWGGPPAGTAKYYGAHFGVSYLSGTSKDWSYSAAHAYRNAGLGVVFVWETAAARSTAGCGAGRADAYAASAEASRLGFAGTPIYFASDFDTTGYSTTGSVGAYYHCMKDVLGLRSGAYGGYNTMTIAKANGVHHLWETLAWSYGRIHSGVCLYQSGINWNWHGYSVDADRALCPDYGQYRFVKPKPKPHCFGRHPQNTALCRAERAKVAKWKKGELASLKVYQGRQCPLLAQRISWYANRIHRYPRSSKTPARRRALHASRVAYRQRSCALFAHRVKYFHNQIHNAEVKY